MPGFTVIIGDTDADARDRAALSPARPVVRAGAERVRTLVRLHDFRRYDLDAPFPVEALEHACNSFYTNAKRLADLAITRRLALREMVETVHDGKASPFVGSAQTVADEIVCWFLAIRASSRASRARWCRSCRTVAYSGASMRTPRCAAISAFPSRATGARPRRTGTTRGRVKAPQQSAAA